MSRLHLMACGCAKRKRAAVGGEPLTAPLGEMRWYAVSPDGTEHEFRTVRAARDFARRSPGSGWQVHGRRL